ncbi:MAG: MBL fold metallo-hydrolase [Elusimicrobia bacterium]|jgi:phosphoribosyl 1,2-cyclic phosphodiesterase|nr:MBL fold metallo-hydrolase [Elusimicrobiota bacterium]
MKLKFWGCRGSIPVPDARMIEYGGNTTCLEVMINGRVIIIDSGTGIRKLGEELIQRGSKDIDMFITHSHWDHIQGFPFFKPIYSDDFNINIFGCKNSYKELKDILSHQMSFEYFPVRFSELSSNINFEDGCENYYNKYGYKIDIIETNHPITTIAFKIENKSHSLVFMTDNELKSKNPKTSHKDFVEFCRGTDYLIHDAQFTGEEYKDSHGWGHSTFEQSMDLAAHAGVGNLVFFHHDPNREDDKLTELTEKYKIMSEDRGDSFNIITAKEQRIIEIS